MPKYDSCLYPPFTESLYKALIQKRQSLNPYGEIGRGRKRILDDLKTILEAENIQVIPINMKACVQNFQLFLDDLNKAIPVMGKDGDFAMWINAVEQKQKPVALFLDNFDALMDNADIHETYQKKPLFVDKLNAIKNKNHIFLLCASTKRHKANSFYLDGKSVTTPFFLEMMNVPAGLSHKQVETELNRMLADCTDWKTCKEEDKRNYIASIAKHHQPYLLLQHIVSQLQNVGIESNIKNKQLQKWIKEFGENQYISRPKRFLKWKKQFWRNFGLPLQIFLVILILGVIFYFIMKENIMGAGITGLSGVAIITFLNQGLGLLGKIFKK